METDIRHLIDFEKVDTLLEGFNKSTGFVTAILDLEGNVLSKSGWRQMCTEFHRINPETSNNCTISDTELANKMGEGEKYHFYKCLNGLVDVAVPIIIRGEHIANLFSGQFFFEEPDATFFKKQAEKYGFDEGKYLTALKNIPVVTEEKVKIAMDFLLNMTRMISDITFQKQEQIELNKNIRESEEKYRLLAENMMDVVWRFDAETGQILYISPNVEKYYGFTSAEIMAVSLADVIVPEQKQAIYALIAKRMANFNNGLLTQSEFFTDELLLPCKDGSTVWTEVVTNYSRDKKSGHVILQGTTRDITKRRQAEEIKKELLKRFELISLHLPGVIYQFRRRSDGSLHFPYASPGIYKIYGVQPKDVEQDATIAFKAIHPDDLEQVSLSINHSAQSLTHWHDIYRVNQPSGKTIWVEGNSTPQKLEDESIIWHGYIQDITMRKQAEEKLKKATLLLQSSIESPKNMIILSIDKNYNYLYFNECHKATMIYAYGKDVKIGTNLLDSITYEEDKIKAKINYDKALNGESHITIEEYGDIEKSYYETRYNPIFNDNNEIIGATAFSADITGRKRAEEKIREKDLQFRKLSANLPDLIYQFTRKPDGSYCVPLSSEGIKNIFGCSPEDVVDDFAPISRVIFPEDSERVIREIEYSANHLSYFTCEFRVQIPGKAIQWILSRSTPEQLPDGSITWYGFNADITVRKQVEQALLMKMNELERFHRITVDRELTMVDLKKEVNDLLKKLGQDKKYSIHE